MEIYHKTEQNSRRVTGRAENGKGQVRKKSGNKLSDVVSEKLK